MMGTALHDELVVFGQLPGFAENHRDDEEHGADEALPHVRILEADPQHRHVIDTQHASPHEQQWRQYAAGYRGKQQGQCECAKVANASRTEELPFLEQPHQLDQPEQAGQVDERDEGIGDQEQVGMIGKRHGRALPEIEHGTTWNNAVWQGQQKAVEHDENHRAGNAVAEPTGFFLGPRIINNHCKVIKVYC